MSGASGILFCLIFIHHRNHISDPNTLVEWCIVHAVNVGIAIACSGQNVTVRTDADFDMHRANAKFQYLEMFTPSQLITFPDRSLDSPEHFSCWTSTAHPSRLRTPSPGARRARTTHSHRPRQTSSRTTCRSRRRGRASCAAGIPSGLSPFSFSRSALLAHAAQFRTVSALGLGFISSNIKPGAADSPDYDTPPHAEPYRPPCKSYTRPHPDSVE